MASPAPRVLVVEDDVAQRRTLRDILRSEGFEPVMCATGGEALDRAAGAECVAAVIDQRLPDFEGTQLLRALINITGPLRGIIHTAYGSFDSARDAVNLGAYAYVEKGGDPELLIEQVRRASDESIAEKVWEIEGCLQSITQYAPDPILQVDRDGVVRFINHGLAGYPLVELLGTPLESWVIENRRARLAAALDRVFGSAEDEECEIAIDDTGGRRHWFECRLGPVFSGRKIVCAVVVARDVTRRKLRESADRILHHLYRCALGANGSEQAPTIRVRRVVLTDEFVARNPGSRVGLHLLISVNGGDRLSPQALEQALPVQELDTLGAEADAGTLYTVVAAAGGHVVFEGEPDGGTTFHIYLPQAT